MNLKPIVDDLQKRAFILSGMFKDDMISMSDVIDVLQKHLGDVYEPGSVNIQHYQSPSAAHENLAKRLEEAKAKYKGPPIQRSVPKPNVNEAKASKEEDELPTEIQFALDQSNVQFGGNEKHPEDSNKSTEGSQTTDRTSG